MTEVKCNRSLLELALLPYKPHCRYLLRATAKRGASGAPLLEAEGDFSIAESCYIADTGHFNAVEFNICYNQLAYYLLAEIIQNGWVPSLSNWEMSDFRQRQLPGCLILQFHSSFHKPLDARFFKGKIEVTRVAVKQGTVFMKTFCEFEDVHGASCKGEAFIAILNNNQAQSAGESITRGLKSSSPRDRIEMMCNYLRRKIAESLAIESHEVGNRDNLMDLGIDSLKAVELKNAVADELGIPLSTSLLFDYPNVEALSGYLLQQLGLTGEQAGVVPQTRRDAGLCEDKIAVNLPQEQVAELLATELQNLNV